MFKIELDTRKSSFINTERLLKIKL